MIYKTHTHTCAYQPTVQDLAVKKLCNFKIKLCEIYISKNECIFKVFRDLFKIINECVNNFSQGLNVIFSAVNLYGKFN